MRCIGQSWLQVTPDQGIISQEFPCREGCRCEPRMANTAGVDVAAQHRGLGEELTVKSIKWKMYSRFGQEGSEER